MMRRIFSLVMIALLLLAGLPAAAANGEVSYEGNAKEFIFAPGSEYSPTDLFPNFKDVMPGDTLTQAITVRNDAANKVKIKVYMRSLGAHEDSVDFLSQLHLRVEKAEDNTMGYMFDAAADETAGLADWVCLGTLYSGGEVNLNVVLDVPTSLDNTYKNLIGYLDWQFAVEELPVEPDDPQAPETGESGKPWLWAAIGGGALLLLILLMLLGRHDKDQKK